MLIRYIECPSAYIRVCAVKINFYVYLNTKLTYYNNNNIYVH